MDSLFQNFDLDVDDPLAGLFNEEDGVDSENAETASSLFRSILPEVLSSVHIEVEDEYLDYVAAAATTNQNYLSAVEIAEVLHPILESAGFPGDETSTVELANTVLSRCRGDNEIESRLQRVDSASAPRMLSSEIKINSFGGISAADAFVMGAGKKKPGSHNDNSKNLIDRRKEARTLTRKQRRLQLRARKREEEIERKQREADEKAANDALEEAMRDVSGDFGDQNCDVVLSNFSLPSKKGSGPDLLTGASVTLVVGRRYGLVGKNGVGKTTFLEALARRTLVGPTKKTSNVPPRRKVMHVRQHVAVGDGRSVLETVLSSDQRRLALEQKAKKLEHIAKEGDNEKDENGISPEEASRLLGNIYSYIAELDARGAPEPIARRILNGLGFSSEQVEGPTASLSGGWRMRVNLASALFVEPSILLLDEPTNHLDLEAVVWLEEYLTNHFSNTLIVVSHDRSFLNSVSTDILVMRNSQLNIFRGNFNQFEETERQRVKQQERLRKAQEMKRAHLQEYITKHAELGSNGPKAARQRKARMKRMERLGMEAQAELQGRKFKQSYQGTAAEVTDIISESEFTLHFPDPGICDGNIVTVIDSGFEYPTASARIEEDGIDEENSIQKETEVQKSKPNRIFDKGSLNFSLDIKSRVALVGRNGCGKSTLIKLIMGKLMPTEGRVTDDRHARIGYVAQHQVEQLDLSMTPLEFMESKFPGDGSYDHILNLRKYLANFALGGDTLPNQKIRTLSGGQKCRLAFAEVLYTKPHLLILDEPTNHLDLETVDALIKAIENFSGGLLVVSHDQHLLSNIIQELWVVGDGKVKVFPGDFDAYKKKVIKDGR
eukprot:g2144.t1